MSAQACKLAALLFGAAVLLAGVSGTTVGAQAPNDGASLGGAVTAGGQPIDGVSVDLFSADSSGNRLAYLRTTTTGGGDQEAGRFGFDVAPGCYSVTVIAPQGNQFTSGARWATTAHCLADGQSRPNIDVELEFGGPAGVTGIVLASGTSDPVDGVVVDLFTATADGSRGSYLRSVETGDGGVAGRYGFEVDPGCYVQTYIAPDGGSWEANGKAWLSQGTCVQAGQEVGVEPVSLTVTSTPPTERVIEVDAVISRDGAAVHGLSFDIFKAQADGSRGDYEASGRTAAADSAVLIDDGCWVVTLIASEGNVFEDSGTRWLNRGFCTDPTTDTYRVEATLSPSSAPPTPLTCAAGAEFELVLRDDFDGSEVADHWNQYNSTGNAGYGLRRPSALTIEDGAMVITAEMVDGNLVSGGVSHNHVQQYGKYEFRVRTDRDPSMATSGVVLTWPASGVHPRDGENNIYETLARRPERSPFYSFIHEPYGTVHDQVYIVHDADGSQFQTMTLEWTPERMLLTREGPGGANLFDQHEIIENADDLIPDKPHYLTIQLDAWKHSMSDPVRMEVDWVEVSKYCE